ncbi:hypothetical protein DENSPDRAFT_858875 [Dentipellis sp. KUC8613]|nr:hypothetical protein DENSPDRAFT_858875 [Dentipellis sp. KUC8613]
MDSPANSLANVPGRPHLSATPAQHQYGTRIRQNSVMKPSARLRQSSDTALTPRRIRPALATPRSKPNPSDAQSPPMPEFPPPNVTLHNDDVNNKTFLAIGRALTSVNNCAMTIKDLAEMCMKYGLVAQNVSAASQSITTYIRTHHHRCDVQQDYPLLARHTLSGTPSDDDLVPALYSRTGGAHCALPPGDNRVTNFRRGTTVWYLSKAAGAPCPFARVGIRLCEYTEDGKIGAVSSKDPKERKRERDRARRAGQCGQKRKRLSRACADGSKDGSESATDEEARPPKVKLTLRLKASPDRPSPTPSSSVPPSSSNPDSREIIDLSKDSEDDEDPMSVDSSSEEEDEEDSTPPSRSLSAVPDFDMPTSTLNFRRSPSVPSSEASPPPDSDDEEGFYNTSRQFRSNSSDPAPWEDEEDFDWDNDDDADDEDEDPGASPLQDVTFRNPFQDNVFVKRESCDDLRGMLDAWEHLDNGISNMKVMEVVNQAVADGSSSKVKVEEPDWDFDPFGAPSPAAFDLLAEDEPSIVKEEDVDFEPSLITGTSLHDGLGEDELVCGSPLTPLSAFSPTSELGEMRWANLRRPSELLWKDAELLGPDSILPHEIEEGDWEAKRHTTQTSAPSRAQSESLSEMSPLPESPSAESDDTQEDGGPSTPPPSLPVQDPQWKSPDLVSEDAILGTMQPVAHSEGAPSEVDGKPPKVVVVHTCQPCTPAISATQVEGISVYQMTVGTCRLLRRIDTDFVNLAPIIHHFQLDIPTESMSSIPNATSITHGTPIVCGTWVPLKEAQAFALAHRQSCTPEGVLDVFLSDLLFERFPPALQEFHRSNARSRLLNQFGPHFQSTSDARRLSQRRGVPLGEPTMPWERGMMSHADVEDHLLAVHPSLALAEVTLPRRQESEDVVVETPLSPTEEEMFQTLCVASDWDASAQEGQSVAPIGNTATATTADIEASDPRNDMDAEVEMEVQVVQEPLSIIRRRSCSRDRPLRRSKRVANALATRPRTRSSRRGSRSSLS